MSIRENLSEAIALLRRYEKAWRTFYATNGVWRITLKDGSTFPCRTVREMEAALRGERREGE